MIEVKFKLAPDAQDLIPTKAHPDDAAFDLRANADMDVPPCKPVLVPTGLFLELPVGYEAQVRPRSGLAIKKAVTVLNTPGTIDAGYRGEVCVLLRNYGKETVTFEPGAKVAQIVFHRICHALEQVESVEALGEGERGAHGFGSTGEH